MTTRVRRRGVGSGDGTKREGGGKDVEGSGTGRWKRRDRSESRKDGPVSSTRVCGRRRGKRDDETSSCVDVDGWKTRRIRHAETKQAKRKKKGGEDASASQRAVRLTCWTSCGTLGSASPRRSAWQKKPVQTDDRRSHAPSDSRGREEEGNARDRCVDRTVADSNLCRCCIVERRLCRCLSSDPSRTVQEEPQEAWARERRSWTRG
mmetsp:Transcript_7605/g.46908  ORF Transcript_7605/g.46908 Transcript_7605/m.46908 type:complete len:206 (-) Transcript_7605:421-1038(-)